ncbi:MAG: metallopeptidase TldD-related protein [Pseudomonadota bacterium]
MTAAALALAVLCVPGALADPVLSSEQRRALLAEEVALHLEQLQLPDAPPLYHLRYHLLALQQASVRASFGALVAHDFSPATVLGAEVRVGSAAFDNTGYGGWESGFGRIGLPQELTAHALRLATWQLSDSTYKEAVEQFARKQAAFVPPPDYPGDYQVGLRQEGPYISVASARLEPVEQLARRLSSVFPVDGGLELGTVLAAWETGTETVVDSEGTDLQRPHAEFVLRAMAQARATDGALLSDHRSWYLRNPSQLPAEPAVELQVAAMTRDLLAWTRVTPLQDEYVGPVIFEDEAAVDLFRTLLVDQLEGTPPPVPFEASFGALGDGFSFASDGSGGGPRLNRRVLPDGWRAVDDPRADLNDPACFAFDLEGTPARRVELVEDGIVRTLLMSRVPRKDIPEGSNGHARGTLSSRAAGRVSHLEVTPRHRLTRRRLLKQAFAIADAYDQDYVMVVRRFQDDLVRAQDRTDSAAFSFLDGGGHRLPVPLALYRVYTDGREEPIRGAAFASVERWALREIAAAGPQVEGRYLAPFSPGGQSYSPLVGMPTTLSVPEVLIEELELVPVSADPRSRPVVPAPGR